MIRVRVEGRRRLSRAVRRVRADLEDAVARAVRAGAGDVREAARDLLDEPGGGRPSAPGAPPHRQSGRLRDSIFVRATGDGPGAEVGTGLDYGAHLEFGTRDMPARPWLLPAVEAATPGIRARLARAVRDAVRRGARTSGQGG